MKKEFSEVINKIFTQCRADGLIQLPIENEIYDGKNVILKGKPYTFWGNCSYMGLETEQRLKDASIDAIQRFGTQFSSSRAALELGQYEELEALLSEMFGKPTLLSPTTSLGHIAIIPLMMGKGDALIMDQKVHNSVKNAVFLTKGEGCHIETLKHSRLDLLENRIQILSQTYNKVWYFIDGVYSMFGDIAPLKDLRYLLDKYEQFHLYVDDAHGMSWTGKNGTGTTMRDLGWHHKMILTTSLAKGFASCGGALVFDTVEQLDLVKNCSSTFIFSGPLQPAVLGASIASAKIHLSDEIYFYQNELRELVNYFLDYSHSLNLPIVSLDEKPIFYIGLGNLEIGNKMSKFLMTNGQYVSNMAFPIVPINNCGIRVCITRHHTKEDIKNLLDMVAEALFIFLSEEGQDIEEVYEMFGITPVSINSRPQMTQPI